MQFLEPQPRSRFHRVATKRDKISAKQLNSPRCPNIRGILTHTCATIKRCESGYTSNTSGKLSIARSYRTRERCAAIDNTRQFGIFHGVFEKRKKRGEAKKKRKK